MEGKGQAVGTVDSLRNAWQPAHKVNAAKEQQMWRDGAVGSRAVPDKMDENELGLQYSPSKWSKRFTDPEEVINHHVQFVTKASENAKCIVPCVTQVRYGERVGQLLDIFGGDKLPNSAPVYVHIHGGYWQEMGREISSYCVPPLYQAGIRVVIVGYDLAPQVKLQTISEEIEEAATYVLKYATELGSRCIIFGGHSAGAHLSAQLLVGNWWSSIPQNQQHIVKGFILLSGVFDLIPIVRTYVNDALELSESDARLLSPLYYNNKQVSAHLPKVLIAVAEHDSPAFFKQSEQFTEKLRQKNYSVEFVIIPNVDHFDLVENMSDHNYIVSQMIINFINFY